MGRASRGLPPPFGPPASLRRGTQLLAQTIAAKGDPHRGTRAGLGLRKGRPCLPLWRHGVRALQFQGRKWINCLHISKLHVYIMDIMRHVPFVIRLSVCSTVMAWWSVCFIRARDLLSLLPVHPLRLLSMATFSTAIVPKELVSMENNSTGCILAPRRCFACMRSRATLAPCSLLPWPIFGPVGLC